MSKHIAILAATSAIGLLAASPAMAQVDDRYAGVSGPVDASTAYGPGWEAEAAAGASYSDAGAAVVQEYYSDPVVADIDGYVPDYVYESDSEYEDYPADGERRRIYRTVERHEEAPRFAYMADQREEWLSQCRALRAGYDQPYYYEEEDDDNGGIIGGLLGAVAGGVIGNRVGSKGDRLAGTLIGAGLGGLAGAVIGAAIDGGDDDDDRYYADEGYGFDYCEAYLLNYERGYGVAGQATYAQVAMVPVAQQPMQQQPQRRMITRVIDEEVEVEHPAPAPRRHIRRAAPAPQGKLHPIK